MLPSWYIPAAFVLAISIAAIMQHVLRNEAKAKDAHYLAYIQRKNAVGYGIMTENEWREMEERLTRQREFDRIAKVVEEARNEDFSS